MTDKTLLEYWFILYDKKVIILVITLSAMITAGVLSKILPPVYEAKAVFFVPKEVDKKNFFTPPGELMARSSLVPYAKEDEQGPYLGILKSQAIAKLVQREFPQKRVIDLSRRDMNFVLSDEYLIEVYARDKNPTIAAGVANAYVKYFNTLMGEYSLPSNRLTMETIKAEITENQKKLSKARGVLKIFQQKNQLAALDEETKQIITMKTNFESQLEHSQVEYAENKNKILETERKLKDEIGAFMTSDPIITSPLLEKLRSQLVDIDAKMATLRAELKEIHPDYVISKKNYEVVKKNIDGEIEGIIKSQIKSPDAFCENLRRQLINLYIDKERIDANRESTKQVLKGIEKRIIAIPALQNQLDTFSVEVDRYKKLVDTLKINLEEVKSQEKRAPQVAIQVDEATPPPNPAFPVLWLNMTVACLSGFLGGICYCFFVNYLEETREKRIYRLWKVLKSIQE